MNIVISGITKGIGNAITKKFLQSTQRYHLFGFAKKAQAPTFLTSWKPLKTDFELSLMPLFTEHRLHIDSIDVKDTEQIKNFALKLIDLKHNLEYRYTQTHILVNNVGIYRTGSLFTEPDSQWQEHFKVNLDAAYYLTKYLYPTFGSKTHIFNICSVASKEIVKDAPSYSISKMAFYGLHKAMMKELEPLGIKVTAILPGAVYTDSWKDAPPAIKECILPAEDIADLIWEICHLSPQSMVREIEIKPLNF